MALSCFTGSLFGQNALVAIAVLLMLMIVAIAYMASKLLQKPDMEAWAKTEGYQVFLSCVIAASMVSLAGIACTVSWEVAQGDSFEKSNAFLSANYDQVTKTILYFYGLKAVIDYMAEYQVYYATNPLFVVPAYPGLSAVSQNLDAMILILSVIMANLMVQKIGLQLIQQLAFAVFLPVGLILRVFPVTRDAGAFLIAVAFGFYIVFPLFYVAAAEVMAQLPEENPPTLLNVPGWVGFPVMGPGFPFGLFFLGNMFAGPVEIMFRMLKDLNFVLAATLFPALNIIITVAFIKSATKSLIQHT